MNVLMASVFKGLATKAVAVVAAIGTIFSSSNQNTSKQLAETMDIQNIDNTVVVVPKISEDLLQGINFDGDFGMDDPVQKNLEGGDNLDSLKNALNKLKAIAQKYNNTVQPNLKNSTNRILSEIQNFEQSGNISQLKSMLSAIRQNLIQNVKDAQAKNDNYKKAFYTANADFYRDINNYLTEYGLGMSNNHNFLLVANQTYKKNYDRATFLFRNDARINCANITKNRKLTTDEQTADLMAVYFDFTRDPQSWTVENKKNFLITYFRDASWNDASAGQINQKFGQLIKGMRERMKNEDLSGVEVPVFVSEEEKVATKKIIQW